MTDTETPLVLNTGGPFTPEYVKQVAAHAAEAIRVLNHATLGHQVSDTLRYPADVDTVLVELASMAQRLPQLCGQLATWLRAEWAEDRIQVTYGRLAGRPDEAVAEAETRLGDAEQAAGQLHEALNAARQLTSSMTAPYDPSEDPDA